jgi:hypothetical protein
MSFQIHTPSSTPPESETWLESPLDALPDDVRELEYQVRSTSGVLGDGFVNYPHGVGLYLARTLDELASGLGELGAMMGHGWEQTTQTVLSDYEDFFAGKALIIWHEGRVNSGTRSIDSVLLSADGEQLIVSATMSFSDPPPPWMRTAILLIEVDNDGNLNNVTNLIPHIMMTRQSR